MRRLCILIAIGIITAGAAAASVNGVAAPLSVATAPTRQSVAKVAIDNFRFQPRDLAIAIGTTVTWVNNDDVPHTVTATGKTPAFASPALDTDDKFTFRFVKAGTYKYYCKVHPHMTGTITVK